MKDTGATEHYTYCHTLPLHAALPISSASGPRQRRPEGDAQVPANGAVASAQLGPSSTLMAGLVLAGLGVGAVATAEALGWEPEVLQIGRASCRERGCQYV